MSFVGSSSVSTLWLISLSSGRQFIQQPMSLPLELVDKCIGEPVWIIMRHEQEYSGKLLGFDDFVNIILEDVTEYAGGKQTKLKKVLLHGRNVTMLIPGAIEGPAAPATLESES